MRPVAIHSFLPSNVCNLLHDQYYDKTCSKSNFSSHGSAKFAENLLTVVDEQRHVDITRCRQLIIEANNLYIGKEKKLLPPILLGYCLF